MISFGWLICKYNLAPCSSKRLALNVFKEVYKLFHYLVWFMMSSYFDNNRLEFLGSMMDPTLVIILQMGMFEYCNRSNMTSLRCRKSMINQGMLQICRMAKWLVAELAFGWLREALVGKWSITIDCWFLILFPCDSRVFSHYVSSNNCCCTCRLWFGIKCFAPLVYMVIIVFALCLHILKTKS